MKVFTLYYTLKCGRFYRKNKIMVPKTRFYHKKQQNDSSSGVNVQKRQKALWVLALAALFPYVMRTHGTGTADTVLIPRHNFLAVKGLRNA